MAELKFRDLKAEEVELRIGSISKTGSGLSLLLYKDARCDMNILDETVGPDNWQRRHYECKGNLYCGISINRNFCNSAASVEWVEKSDCGVESRADGSGNEKKGEASDSFKRAGVNWGIGRELYTSPFVWINAKDAGLKDNGRGGYETKDKFSVKELHVKDKRITGLSVKNDTKKMIVFEWGDCLNEGTPSKKKDETTETKLPIPPSMVKEIVDYFRDKEGLIETLVHYGVDTVEELNSKQASAIIKQIHKKQNKG